MRVAAVFIGLALLLMVAAPPSWAVTATAGFIHENAQMFVIGELVDVEDLESDNFNASDVEKFFYFSVTPDVDSDLDKNIRMHIEFSRLGEVIYESWTREPFTLETWVNSPIGDNGRYTNDQINDLKATPWFNEDLDRSTQFSAETLTGVLDGGNLAGDIYIIKIEVFEVIGNQEIPLAYALSPIQITSPSRPQAVTPMNGDEVHYPVFLSWTGVGGQVMPGDVELILVEADEGDFDDLQTIIDNRSIVNTRYEGPAQFVEYHAYTGAAGTEQPLTDGRTYVWMVCVDVQSAGGQTYTFCSSPESFVYTEMIDVDPDDLLGGGGGGEQEMDGVEAEDGIVNNPPEERDTNVPIPDLVFSVLLQGGLTQAQIDELISAFEGYYVQDMTFDGQNGQTYSTLAKKLNTPGLEVITIIYDEEE